MAMISNLDLIRRVPLFSLLTNDQAQGIADAVVKRRFRRGEIIVEHMRKSNSLFILLTIKNASNNCPTGSPFGSRCFFHS